MILTWNFDQKLDLTRETCQRQKVDDDVMLVNCELIVIFLNYGQFGAIRFHTTALSKGTNFDKNADVSKI